MTKLWCVFVVVIGFHYGTSQEETTTVIPSSSPAVDVLNKFLTDTEAGSGLTTILAQFIGNNTDVSPYLDALEDVFYSFFDNETTAEIGQAVATILQDPEAIRNFLNNNGDAVLEFTKVFMQNVTDETSEIRQQILKDVILAGLRALSTEVGQTFVRDVTTNILSSLLSNGGNPASNIIRMATSYAGIGSSADGASSAISSLIGNNPLLSVFANAEATGGSILGPEFDNFLKKYATASASSSASSAAVVNGDTSAVAS